MKDNNMLNVESLAEEFNVQPKLIRSTVENIMNYYNIDPALVVKRTTKSGNPKWLIHESLREFLAKELLPDRSIFDSTRYFYGKKKPSLDYYDKNYE